MCGIVGIVNHDIDNICHEDDIIKMRDVQTHRGPDDAGFYVNKNVGLGHRRLSIIDLVGGHQPITNENKRKWIVFNGEIYNFKEIRNDLISKGHVFKTLTDTETILHLYEEKGEDCVNDLRGMFAFAIWDEENHSLFIARDRIGIKPLYFTHTKDSFLFSSEIKSFFENKNYLPQINESKITEYFVFREIAGEDTLFNNIKSLLPGHTLTFKNKEIKIRNYWSAFPTNNEFLRISETEALTELENLLISSVKDRLMSDVPLGTFCSGGIDSSLVTAIAALNKADKINTFSVGFFENDYDESYYARIVSDKYNTNHHEIKVSNSEFADLLPKMIWHNDLPLNFANSIQIFAISKLAKDFVTVVLTGEGSDELFAGYPRYHIPNMVLQYKRIPKFLKYPLQLGSKILNDHRISKIEQNLNKSLQDMIIFNTSHINVDLLSEYENFPINSDFDYRKKIFQKGEELNLDVTTNLSLQDQHNYLLSILNRQDKMSMAASIESRVPFLDHRIIEFANKLSPELKNRRLGTKIILKKLALKYLPKEIVHRKKSGFGVPLDKWLKDKNGLGRYFDVILDNSSTSKIFTKKTINNLIEEHLKSINDHSDILWEMINFQLWCDQFKIK